MIQEHSCHARLHPTAITTFRTRKHISRVDRILDLSLSQKTSVEKDRRAFYVPRTMHPHLHEWLTSARLLNNRVKMDEELKEERRKKVPQVETNVGNER
ncbi:hypothetical protein CEXT_194671 [Caerostris extrusa]|uniref:Uncharacterized protein n=1 Tax=Caerostris extrusa TaxID=172846 RepID=A0AAV4XF68_CAEEX|nr:hypothetical protein CEXT_194671 [Caerostris extrusa]